MKMFWMIGLLFLSVSAMAARNCATESRNLKKDLTVLGDMMDSGPVSFRSRKDNFKEVLKDFIADENDGDDSSYQYVWFAKSFGVDEAVAGTATRGAVRSAIMSMAETYYSEDAQGEDQLKAIKKATDNVLANDIIIGFDSYAQGWGGSPANNLLFMIPDCKVAYKFFLGISHD